MTGVTARIEEGRVIACHDGLGMKANAWAAATAADWLDTVIEPDAKRVRTGGDRWLLGRRARQPAQDPVRRAGRLSR